MSLCDGAGGCAGKGMPGCGGEDCALSAGPDAAQRGGGYAQKGRDISQVDAPADVGKGFQQFFVTFFGRKRQAIDAGGLKREQAFLMDDASPVGNFDVLSVNAVQCLYGEGIGQRGLQSFDKFESGNIVIEAEQSEGDVPLFGKPGGVFSSSDEAIGTRNALFDEINVPVDDAALYDEMAGWKMVGSEVAGHFFNGAVGHRVKMLDGCTDIWNGVHWFFFSPAVPVCAAGVFIVT